jgi:hypothetical protein
LPQRGSRSLFVDGSLNGNSARREDPHFPLGEGVLSLSQGESMEDLFISVISGENLAPLLSLGSTKTLYIPLILPGFISRGKKLLLNWGG